ncbi:MAG: CDP-diacylglycerol--serine O-phosphatidyltransferase [Nitrospirae bacterium RIFCSPLOWO2_02_FULL_62_14]|nr:MAG: CDP-diacylglycerol--serine O-phosphatidyltransferase [Nitrospirae bacterium RIFCSPLOWO2_02_FULL_62_14]OGW69996.1 MAG: CDP-diacylglycerol--serine O-phosphatidyltransferase [Nitrospirae bacterium RIFCSPLOWO2_01_FULL_62_17]OGW93406.1 MAG: CDP-diacylglycerol--serine O-phosphatidyltransferase [Nitrospirae bacterium RIFCSPLOWO2_12_FULL_63_8]
MRATILKEPRRRRAVYLIPNLLTTGNLFSGLFAILAVFKGHFIAAAVAIMVALIFDMLDGKSARWTNSTSQFGVEYDSLADLVAFGVAPGLLMYGWALSVYDMLGPSVMFAFVACGALRLARFNVMTATSESKYFTGLPIPAAASVVATLVIFDREVAQFGLTEKPVMVLVLTLALAFLMVSTIKYRSFKDLKFSGRAHFDNLVLAILVLMLVIAWPQVMLFVLFACYAVSGPVERVILLLLKPFGKRQAEQQTVLGTKE